MNCPSPCRSLRKHLARVGFGHTLSLAPHLCFDINVQVPYAQTPTTLFPFRSRVQIAFFYRYISEHIPVTITEPRCQLTVSSMYDSRSTLVAFVLICLPNVYRNGLLSLTIHIQNIQPPWSTFAPSPPSLFGIRPSSFANVCATRRGKTSVASEWTCDFPRQRKKQKTKNKKTDIKKGYL